MRASGLFLAVLLCASASRAALSPEKSEDLRRVLDHGLWSDRVHAVYEAGAAGGDGLALLEYASQDRDWQVRLAAAHFMGKAGPRAAPALRRLADAEDCNLIRLSAFQWLAAMGVPAPMTPEDEELLKTVPDRYGTGRMGQPLVLDTGGKPFEFFQGGLDLRLCASCEQACRPPRPEAEASAPPAPPPDAKPPEAPAAEAPRPEAETPEQRRRNLELDELLASGGSTETLSGGVDLPARGETKPDPFIFSPKRDDPEIEALVAEGLSESLSTTTPSFARAAPKGAAKRESPPGRSTPAGKVRPSLGEAQALPPGGAGLVHESGAAAAGLVADAGTGKTPVDAIPVLLERLRQDDPRTRARAADDLGKRGAAAVSAVPALRRAVRDPDRRVRASAALALGNIGLRRQSVVDSLKRAMGDPDEDVRFSARLALGRLRS